MPGDNQNTCDVNGDLVFTDNCFYVFVYDRQGGGIERVSVDASGGQANDWSYSGGLSADGRFVAFTSYATNLVPGDTNGWSDVFVKDRQTGSIERVSVDGSGGQATNGYSQGGVLSADGRFVGFSSYAPNLVPGDTNGDSDAFVKDRHTGAIERVSIDSSGNQAADGGYFSQMTPDGRYVVFLSRSPDLVPGAAGIYTEVFVHDRVTGETSQVSVSTGGIEGNGGSYEAEISADGRFVFFSSAASNLIGVSVIRP